MIDSSCLYIPFTTFTIVGSSNAINITNGLDGLAGNQVIAFFVSLRLVAYITQANKNITLLCIAFVGPILSFLWFNAHSAKVFMADVGSLSISSFGINQHSQ